MHVMPPRLPGALDHGQLVVQDCKLKLKWLLPSFHKLPCQLHRRQYIQLQLQ